MNDFFNNLARRANSAPDIRPAASLFDPEPRLGAAFATSDGEAGDTAPRSGVDTPAGGAVFRKAIGRTSDDSDPGHGAAGRNDAAGSRPSAPRRSDALHESAGDASVADARQAGSTLLQPAKKATIAKQPSRETLAIDARAGEVVANGIDPNRRKDARGSALRDEMREALVVHIRPSRNQVDSGARGNDGIVPADSRAQSRESGKAAIAQQVIRVSIGRIDIRAVAKDARPPAATLSKPATLSLEDYLKKRSEERA